MTATTRKFQIRNGHGRGYGLALYDATSPLDALLSFIADRARGDARSDVKVLEDGSAEITTPDGRTFKAVPFDEGGEA